MPYELHPFTCPHGCAPTFWTLNVFHTHHLETHERPLPPQGQALHGIVPPVGGVAPTAWEIARAGLEAATSNGPTGAAPRRIPV